MIPPQDEADTLRAMLGIGPPVLLDTTPGPLTAGERRRFAERLAAVTAEPDDTAQFRFAP
jgi:hypothetical protein